MGGGTEAPLAALREIARENLAGTKRGLPAYCTAHPTVLRTILRDAAERDRPVLVEATCNQVNQEGGYTGLQPAAFIAEIRAMAAAAGLAENRLILGGDHLGPNPWRKLPARVAMERATVLVGDYVRAGFVKIHLDASMPLGSDPARLAPEQVAERAATLCLAAEQAGGAVPPLYVIGTEVPVPGGETGGMGAVAVTSPQSVQETMDSHRRAFARHGLEDAFARVIGIVAQPGVDFDQSGILPFAPAAAGELAAALPALGGVVGEAHSTDYQSEAALRGLVTAHFAILKVGPELTFAYREAVLGLAAIEREVVPAAARSRIEDVLLARMAAEPRHWAGYYDPDGRDLRLLQLYSYSDRVRYYWPDPAVTGALATLLDNLARTDVPAPLRRQFLHDEEPPPTTDPLGIVQRAVGRVVRRYEWACRPAG